MLKLDPCPFCGCEMAFVPSCTDHFGNRNYIPAAKGNNAMYGPHKRGCIFNDVEFKYWCTKRTLVKKWNRRIDSGT